MKQLSTERANTDKFTVKMTVYMLCFRQLYGFTSYFVKLSLSLHHFVWYFVSFLSFFLSNRNVCASSLVIAIEERSRDGQVGNFFTQIKYRSLFKKFKSSLGYRLNMSSRAKSSHVSEIFKSNRVISLLCIA